ncbi:uncharacterized protein LOC118241676 isoform X2 [Electrophorus electricus]|uniref:uncharacterized protein LOC118241676 isoform X2 n=1 Tax=Electrophorus electricus TaxID=8005 RepID=UPI0015CFBDD4|nr:uncharacterized protein LOC118241676 isoform X2 [Electrophorus electricus]
MQDKLSNHEFKEVGSSVQLHIKVSIKPFKTLKWMHGRYFVLTYDKKLNTVEPGRAYNGRVKLDKDTYSLTMKSLQKNDSGFYIAKSIDEEGENSIVQYKLSVLDPVESPILTPVPHQLSSDPCNVTLTCSGHNLTIHSNCSNDVCEEKKIESPGGNILSMYVSGSTIICNHSNPVSWKKSAIKEIKEICFSIGPTNQLLYIVIALSCVALILLLTVIGCVIQLRRKKTDGIDSPVCDTVYAEVENENERPRNGMRLEISGPSSLYSVVGVQLPHSEGSTHAMPNPLYHERNQQKAYVDQSLPNSYGTAVDTRSNIIPSTIYSTVDLSKPETIYGVVKKCDDGGTEGPRGWGRLIESLLSITTRFKRTQKQKPDNAPEKT